MWHVCVCVSSVKIPGVPKKIISMSQKNGHSSSENQHFWTVQKHWSSREPRPLFWDTEIKKFGTPCIALKCLGEHRLVPGSHCRGDFPRGNGVADWVLAVDCFTVLFFNVPWVYHPPPGPHSVPPGRQYFRSKVWTLDFDTPFYFFAKIQMSIYVYVRFSKI